MLLTDSTLSISKVHDTAIIKDIITSDGLWEVSYGQNTSDTAKQNFEVEQNGFEYLLIRDSRTANAVDSEVVGCIQIRPLTKILLECHIYILKKYWGTGISTEAVKAGFEHVKYELGFRQCFTDVPVSCKEVQNLLKKTGWVRCGLIRRGVIFDNKLQDLLFYSYDLTRV